MATKTVNVGLVQLSCSGNVTENMQKTTAGIREAAQKGAQVVVLQEL
ncbi:MAG: acyltransferase, partial [Algoriphagus sp.]